MMACPLCEHDDVRLLVKSARRGVSGREFHQCAGCRLIFVPPAFHLSADEEKQRYDLHQNDPDDERYVRFLSKLAQPLLEHLDGPQEGLDLGCGPGPAAAGLLERAGHHVVNFDPYYFPSAEALARSYDFIFCSEVIEHFRQPREEFRRLDSLVKPGGTIGIMTEVVPAPPPQPIDSWWYTTEPTHLCFYAAQTLEWISGWLDWLILHRQGNVAIFRKNPTK